MTVLRNISAVLLGALVVVFVALNCAQGAGFITPVGINFELRSGLVRSVTPGSAAALAGVRPGDYADFERGGWRLHLSLDRMGLLSGQRLSLPLVRQGRPFTAMLVGARPSLPANAWTYFVTAFMSVVYFALGLTLFLLKRSPASFTFYLFAAGTAIAVADSVGKRRSKCSAMSGRRAAHRLSGSLRRTRRRVRTRCSVGMGRGCARVAGRRSARALCTLAGPRRSSNRCRSLEQHASAWRCGAGNRAADSCEPPNRRRGVVREARHRRTSRRGRGKTAFGAQSCSRRCAPAFTIAGARSRTRGHDACGPTRNRLLKTDGDHANPARPSGTLVTCRRAAW